MMTLIALGTLDLAHAQDTPCAPYSHTWWSRAMDDADAALAQGDVESARRVLGEAHHSLLCLDAIADPALMSRFDRQLGLTFFFDQDEDAVRRWGLASRYADAGAPWPEMLGEGHPYRQAVTDAEEPIVGIPE